MALDIHDKNLLCSCGCGFYRDDSHAQGFYAVDESTVCFARGILEQFQKDNPDLEPGTLLRVVDVSREKAPSRTQFNTSGKAAKTVDHDVLG